MRTEWSALREEEKLLTWWCSVSLSADALKMLLSAELLSAHRGSEEAQQKLAERGSYVSSTSFYKLSSLSSLYIGMDHGVLCGVGDLSDIERICPWRLAGGSSLLLVNIIYFCRAKQDSLTIVH